MRYSLIILLLVGFSAQVNCQIEIPKHALGVQIGLGYNQLKDKLSSRLIYSGVNYPLKIKYINTSIKHQFIFGISGNFSKPKSRFNDKALLVNYALHAGYNYILNNNENWQVKVGGEIPFQTTIDFFEDVQSEYFYWNTSLSLNPVITVEKPFGSSNAWFATAKFPLVGAFSRPPPQRFTNAEDNFGFILSETNKNYQFLLPTKYVQIDFEGGLTYQLRNKIRQSLSYSFSYLKNQQPEPISIIRHQLNLSTNINWK